MWLTFTIAFFVCALAAVAILGRFRPGGNFLARFLLCGSVGWAALAIVGFALDGPSLETIAGLVLFAFAWELSIFLFAFVTTSVSVGLLVRLKKRRHSQSELRNAYTTQFMVETRLDRLVSDGFLVPVANGYRLSPKSRLVLRVFNFMRQFFRHASGVTPPAMRQAEASTPHAG
jgi:hypothetical protein